MQLTTDPGVFPPSPPPSTTDPTVIAAHDWAAFAAVQKMTNHWDRPGWTEHTRAYYWMLTLPEDAPLVGHMQQCQHALASLRFDDIAADGLHLTLGRIGLVEDVTAGHLDRLAAAAQGRAPERFTLRAIPLAASRGAIRYSVAPWTPLINLHQMLGAVGAESGLPFRKPSALLRPHIGLAYANRPLPADQVRAALRPLRDLDTVGVPFQQLHLVELRREGRAYRWRTVHSVNLTPAQGNSPLHGQPA
ncbi:2'-5' RNA ligase family protein [Streptomyces xanthochromogenes]|uniref:2'-5' RNA ligase family protein n=1 Tax=Streptomyces xanthochromogenes TaxID=67384 RepID=UPI00342C1AC9